MNFLTKFFGGFRGLIATVAQIVIVILLLPLLCIALYSIIGPESSNFLWELISDIDLFSPFVQFFKMNAGPNTLTVLEVCVEEINHAMPEALFMGLCIQVFKTLGIMVNIKGLPILQSVAGIFVGCLVIKYIDVMKDPFTLYSTLTFLLLLNALLILFAAPGQYLKKVLSVLLGISICAAATGFFAAYFTINVMILRGLYPLGSFLDWLRLTGVIAPIILAIVLLLLFDKIFLEPNKL